MATLLFHVVNYVFAALMYTLLGRFILMFFYRPDSTNYIWRCFVILTEPVLRVTNWLTPALVPFRLRFLAAFLWLTILRAVAFVVFNPTAGIS